MGKENCGEFEMSKAEIVIGDKHIPVKYMLGDNVYYAFFKRGKWALLKTTVDSFYFTNILNYKFMNGWVTRHEERIFTNREEAIEYCLAGNKKVSVKIYGEWTGWLDGLL